jgi:hypothetical protein
MIDGAGMDLAQVFADECIGRTNALEPKAAVETVVDRRVRRRPRDHHDNR